MKFLCVKLIVLLFLTLVIRESTTAQTRFGLTGGFNVADLRYITQNIDNNTSIKAKALGSFHVGVVMDYSATWWMSLQPEIIVTGKGANVKIKDRFGNATYRMHPWYAEIPVNLLFKPAISYSSKLYVGGGPYLAFALGGKGKYSGQPSSTTYYSDHDLRFGNGANKDMRMIDWGVNILAGVEFNGSLRLGLQYNLGLRNLAPKNNNDAPGIIENRGLNITLTMLFGQRFSPYY